MRLKFNFSLLFLLFSQTLLSQSAIPFYYSQSLIFIKVKVNNKKDLLFLLNTGANTTVLDKQTASLLKLKVLSRDTVNGTAGKEKVDILQLQQISIGNTSVSDIKATRRDLSNFIQYNGKKIDGILATDFLKNFVITIDFKSKKLAFSKQSLKQVKQFSIPFEMNDGIPFFEARLDDTLNTYLRYNSGVSSDAGKDIYVNVSTGQWKKIKQIERGLTPDKYFTAKGVGGDLYMQVVKIKSLQLDRLTIQQPYIVVQPPQGTLAKDEAVGFFGNNLLEKYNKVIIDFLNNCIVFSNLRKN